MALEHNYQLRDLGVQKLQVGRFSEAENYLKDSSQGLGHALGRDSCETLKNNVCLADAYICMGQYNAAGQILDDAVEKLNTLNDEKTIVTNMVLAMQAKLFGNTGQREKLRDIKLRLVSIFEEQNGDIDQCSLDAFAQLADALEVCNERQEALTIRQRHFEALKKMHEPYHHDVLASMSDLAHATDAIGDFDHFQLAEQLYIKAIGIASSNLGNEHADTLAILANYAASLLRERRLLFRYRVWQALEMIVFVLEGKQKQLGNNDPATLSAVKDLGVLLDFHGQYESASKLFQHVVDGSRTTPGPCHESTIAVMEKLAMTMNAWGRSEDAQEIANEVFQIRKEQFGEHAQMSNRLFVRRIKIWYELCFKYQLADDRAASNEGSKTSHKETKVAHHEPAENIHLPSIHSERDVSTRTNTEFNLGAAAGAVLPHASVWELKAHLSLKSDNLEYCTKAEFYGWEEQPEQPVAHFKEKFRVDPSYFGNIHDGVYLVRHDETRHPGELVLEQITIPREGYIVALVLGEELSGYKQTSGSEDQDTSDTELSTDQPSSAAILGSRLSALDIKARFPPYQPLSKPVT